ncbi:hypothetical protein NC651_012293 [Populus alba x Populus x berolinensis]|nr:hypothetical protein NC651_012293 [Populus alba x Populus x berolinensis]
MGVDCVVTGEATVEGEGPTQPNTPSDVGSFVCLKGKKMKKLTRGGRGADLAWRRRCCGGSAVAWLPGRRCGSFSLRCSGQNRGGPSRVTAGRPISKGGGGEEREAREEFSNFFLFFSVKTGGRRKMNSVVQNDTMPPLYNTYGAWVLRSKCYKDKPKTELPKLIWSKLDLSETLSFTTILLSPKTMIKT